MICSKRFIRNFDDVEGTEKFYFAQKNQGEMNSKAVDTQKRKQDQLAKPQKQNNFLTP